MLGFFASSGVASAAIGTPTSLGSAAPGSAGASASVTLSTSVPVGNVVIVTAAIDGSTNTVTVSDTAGNTYTKDADQNNTGGSGGVRIVVFSAPVTNALSSGNTITLSVGTPSQRMTMRALSVSGVMTPKDMSGSAQGSGTSANSGSVTTTAADELLIGAIGASFSPTDITAGSGWTSSGAVQSSGQGTSLLPMYRIVSAIGSYSATGSLSGSDSWSAAIATYKATPSTATLTVVKHMVTDSGGTATAADWTLTVSSSNGGTGTGSAPGSETGTVYTLQAGKAYSVAESGGPAGYSSTPSGDCSIASATGGANYTCTITNDDEPGHLLIIKNTSGGDGSFGFNVSGPSSSLDTFSTSGGTGNNGTINVIAGTYSVTENVPSGWHLDSAVCDNGTSVTDGVSGIVIGNGQTVQCTFANTKYSSITVQKDVTAPGGGVVSDTHAFSVQLNGTDAQTISESAGYTYTNLLPGTYTVTENTDGDYEFVSFSQDGDMEAAGAQITIAAGQDVTLTVTNKQKQAHLTVIKIVNNPNGGSATSENFTMSVTGANVSQASFPGSDSGTTITLDPGSFSVDEIGPEGYYLYSSSGACTGTAGSNATLTCTFTNSDIPAGYGVITVRKTVISNNGGDLSAGSFTIHVTDGETDVSGSPAAGSASGVPYTLAADASYTVSEESPTSLGYAETGISCQPVGGGEPTTGQSVTLALADQQAYICTVTNDDVTPRLTLVKNVNNGEGTGSATAGEWTLSASGPTPISGASGSGAVTNVAVNAGVYTLSESGGPAGYTQGSYSCTGTGAWEDGMLTLALGQEATCTITNTAQPAHLTIIKQTEDESGDGTFGFSVVGTGETSFSQGLEISTEGGSGSYPSISLPAGSFTVTETGRPEGWRVSGVSCVSGETGIGQDIENGKALTLGNGISVTCTFRNTTKAPETPPAPPANPPAANGPIVGAGGIGFLGQVLGASIGPSGQVLGASTSTDQGAACSALITQVPMGQGLQNDASQVKALQGFLNGEMGSGLPISGFFGPLTKAATDAFQLKYWQDVLAPWVPFGLPSDHTPTGIVGKTTAWKINMIHCPALALPFPALP